MPGPKPKAETIFGRISVELTRLRNLCDTPQQHEVLTQYQRVLSQIMPLWTDQPIPLPTKRTTPSEREQSYREAEARLMGGRPVPKPSYADKLRWHEQYPDKHPHPDDDLT